MANKNKLELDSTMITLGTDINEKFAWAVRRINGEKHICLYNRRDGWSTFTEKDFITAIPFETIEQNAQRLK